MQVPQITTSAPLADGALILPSIPVAGETLAGFDTIMQDVFAADATALPEQLDWAAILLAAPAVIPMAPQLSVDADGSGAAVPVAGFPIGEIQPDRLVESPKVALQPQELPTGAKNTLKEWQAAALLRGDDSLHPKQPSSAAKSTAVGAVAPVPSVATPEPPMPGAQPIVDPHIVMPPPSPLAAPAMQQTVHARDAATIPARQVEAPTPDLNLPTPRSGKLPDSTQSLPAIEPTKLPDRPQMAKTAALVPSSLVTAMVNLPPVRVLPLAETAGQGRDTEQKMEEPRAAPKPVEGKVLPEPVLRVAALDDPAQIATSASPQPHSHHAQSAPPQMQGIAQQVGQAIQQVLQAVQTPDGQRFELSLAPEELGKIQFDLAPKGDSLRLVVFVERPETLDLMRRHAEQLLTELRNAGFSQTSLDMGSWGQREQAQTAPVEAKSTSPFSDSLIAAMPQDQSVVAHDGRLHLRL